MTSGASQKLEWNDIPASAVQERFITSSGPGGQNVNKVATAVQMRVNIFALGLTSPVYHRLKKLAASYLNIQGEIVITARTHRTQAANRQAAQARFLELLNAAHIAPAKRKKTRINRVGKVKRLAQKKSRADIKKGRGRVKLD
jgi:ribosome-associated protein